MVKSGLDVTNYGERRREEEWKQQNNGGGYVRKGRGL